MLPIGARSNQAGPPYRGRRQGILSAPPPPPRSGLRHRPRPKTDHLGPRDGVRQGLPPLHPRVRSSLLPGLPGLLRCCQWPHRSVLGSPAFWPSPRSPPRTAARAGPGAARHRRPSAPTGKPRVSSPVRPLSPLAPRQAGASRRQYAGVTMLLVRPGRRSSPKRVRSRRHLGHAPLHSIFKNIQ
ncbi:hypothetical protein NDU88_006943 [Pleurodeles waltl]|uniref:Uncharacterized protein n=1 Tax=Pleurodeles waltl TaxID=8319 RepID=A0AAV7TYN1_PLEWA|nr:hypothetical protein NDU88_006943 [Pleurodeles waltl]